MEIKKGYDVIGTISIQKEIDNEGQMYEAFKYLVENTKRSVSKSKMRGALEQALEEVA